MNVGVVLSGCGVYDGAEIHEATLVLYYLDRAGVSITCMAPNVPQMHVVNHTTGEPTNETRNILVEAARIARGEIRDMASVKEGELDALIFPGGYGAAKNLCDFAVKGVDCNVHPEVERLINEMHAAGKPQGFICIAPVLAAKVLGKYGPRLTIGNDAATAQAISAMGAVHLIANVDEIVICRKNRIVTTPAYMLGPTISHVARGIEKLVDEVVNMARK
jgi:enhancing lycopene biosynthesis protein 2